MSACTFETAFSSVKKLGRTLDGLDLGGLDLGLSGSLVARSTVDVGDLKDCGG